MAEATAQFGEGVGSAGTGRKRMLVLAGRNMGVPAMLLRALSEKGIEPVVLLNGTEVLRALAECFSSRSDFSIDGPEGDHRVLAALLVLERERQPGIEELLAVVERWYSEVRCLTYTEEPRPRLVALGEHDEAVARKDIEPANVIEKPEPDFTAELTADLTTEYTHDPVVVQTEPRLLKSKKTKQVLTTEGVAEVTREELAVLFGENENLEQ